MSANKHPYLPGTAVLFGTLLWSNATALGGACGRGVVIFLYLHRTSYVVVGVFRSLYVPRRNFLFKLSHTPEKRLYSTDMRRHIAWKLLVPSPSSLTGYVLFIYVCVFAVHLPVHMWLWMLWNFYSTLLLVRIEIVLGRIHSSWKLPLNNNLLMCGLSQMCTN